MESRQSIHCHNKFSRPAAPPGAVRRTAPVGPVGQRGVLTAKSRLCGVRRVRGCQRIPPSLATRQRAATACFRPGRQVPPQTAAQAPRRSAVAGVWSRPRRTAPCLCRRFCQNRRNCAKSRACCVRADRLGECTAQALKRARCDSDATSGQAAALCRQQDRPSPNGACRPRPTPAPLPENTSQAAGVLPA